jgi:uncharacterized delta-60 repeat protein
MTKIYRQVRGAKFLRKVRKVAACLILLLTGASIAPPACWGQAGFLDPNFLDGMSGPNSWLWAVGLQADDKVLVAGQFTSFNGVTRGPVARLYDDGSVDTNFTATVTAGEPTIHSVAAQPDGKILIGGMFTGVNGAIRNSIARLNANGTLDPAFTASVTGSSFITVSRLALQTNSQIVIGGSFNSVNGTPRDNLARLNPDGSLDAGYAAGTDTPPNAMVLGPDGKLLIGGAFSTVNGVAQPHIARLNADGSLDTNFLVQVDGNVDSFSVQPDAKVLIAGAFTTVNATNRNRIARLNSGGTLDTSFQNQMSGADGYVNCIAAGLGGKVFVGGQYTTINSVPQNPITRLNSDGSLDTNFVVTADSFPEQMLVQPDGRVLVIGSYLTTVDGQSRNRIARLLGNNAPTIGRVGVSAGVFSMEVPAIPGRTYGVQASTNLVFWSLVLQTNVTADRFMFQDTQVSQFPQRFFRIFRAP